MAIDLIDQALKPIRARWPDRIDREMLYPPVPAFCATQHTDLLQMAKELTGFEPTSAYYSTEAPFISRLGCDTLVLGPGSIEQAHTADEWIKEKDLQAGADFYQDFLMKVGSKGL